MTAEEDINFLDGEYVLAHKSGKPLGILIGLERYEELIDAAEELEDIALAEEALRDHQPNIPWEAVKTEFDL
jgi:hypothetical protein